MTSLPLPDARVLRPLTFEWVMFQEELPYQNERVLMADINGRRVMYTHFDRVGCEDGIHFAEHFVYWGRVPKVPERVPELAQPEPHVEDNTDLAGRPIYDDSGLEYIEEYWDEVAWEEDQTALLGLKDP